MVKLLQKTNGTGDPAPGIESVYCENYEPAADILAALEAAVDTGKDIEMTEGRIARPATIAEAAVHRLRRGGEVLYANRDPKYAAWHPVARYDEKPVGSHVFLYGRVFHAELSARIYAQLEATFGRTGAGSHLHGPHLRPGEACEKVSVDAATITETNGTEIMWVRHHGLWFAAWRRAKQAPRAAFIDAADPVPGPGRAFPRIAIS